MSVLISFEGIDGSGKSTIIEKTSNFLGNSVITREPRGTNLGYKIWEIINDSIEKKDLINGKRSNLFLFLASHSEHVDNVIKPLINEKKNVLIDRYIDSTFVYQCLNKNLEIEKVFSIMKEVIESPIPEITFIMDIDPKIAQDRINKRKNETGEHTNFDSLDIKFHNKIRNYFYQLKKIFPDRIVLINANQDPDNVFADVVSSLKDRKII